MTTFQISIAWIISLLHFTGVAMHGKNQIRRHYKVYGQLSGSGYLYTNTVPSPTMTCKVHVGTACTISATVSASYFNTHNAAVFPTIRTPHVIALHGLSKIYG